MNAEEQLLVLVYARALVARNWARRSLAYDIWRRRVSPIEQGARSFCAVGAIARAEHDLCLRGPKRGMAGYDLPVPRIPRYAMGMAIGTYNDSVTKQEVLDLFDKRIAELRKEIDARSEAHTTDAQPSRPAMARVPRLAPWPVDDEPRSHRPLVGPVSYRG